MGFGNWIEEQRFEFPADEVFETLVAVLVHLGLEIETWDATLRGVTAHGKTSLDILHTLPQRTRVAASVRPSSERTATVAIESGPAYDPQMWGERRNRKQVEQILTALSQALGEPQ
jgi:hypothetical protein